MTSDLSGSVALVTGGSRGIGYAIGAALRRRGARVYIVGRDGRRLEQAARELEALGAEPLLTAGTAAPEPQGGAVVPLACDLSQADEVSRLIADFSEERLDILVNNAGLAQSAYLEETGYEDWLRHFRVNVDAPFRLMTGLLSRLRGGKNPCVVNIGSVVSTKGYVKQGAYASSKHALLGLTKVFAREVHEAGIRVFSVEPGGVATDMVREMRPDIDESALTQPAEIAETVMHLIGMTGGAMIDQVQIRRAPKEPWQ